jgi:GTPase SAR1 family protein
MPENHDLNIGIKSDFSSFNIDLKSLTRGLVIVGQSGCGKSFFLGRLLEEILLNSTDLTQILLIDANSDFCYGFNLREISDLKKIINKYIIGTFKDGFDIFKSRELSAIEEISVGNKFGESSIFTLNRPPDALLKAELI